MTPVPRTTRRPRTALAVVAAVAAMAAMASGCGDDPTTAPTTTTAPAGPLPSLERLPPDPGHGALDNPAAAAAGPGLDDVVAPAEVACRDGGDAAVPLQWSAPTARVVRVVVDGEPVAGDLPAVGATEVAVPCDGGIHVLLVAAVGDEPEPSVASVAVRTAPEG